MRIQLHSQGQPFCVSVTPNSKKPLKNLPHISPCCSFSPAQMMSKDMETADVSEVDPEAPQPTHIDVHIHQESVLAKLLLAGCSMLRVPASASIQSQGSSRVLVASWVRVATCLMGHGRDPHSG